MNDTIQNDDLFKDIVGQVKPKKELGFYIDSYKQTRMIPNLMLNGAKGQGKSTLALAIAKGLVQFDELGQIIEAPSKADSNVTKPKRKPFVEVNCSTLKSVKQFINGFIIPYCQDKDVTIFFDEASEIPHPISMALLTILNPNPSNRTTFSMEEYVCDFDFRRQSFIFATSEIHKVFHALVDRLERITLEDYSNNELAQIVQKGISDVSCENGVLEDVSTVLRGNARAAQKMANKISAYLKGKKAFTKLDWTDLKEVLSINPLGLNAIEIQILRHLSQNMNGTSLTALSAKTGMSRESLQKDSELYLQKNSLMSIETTGRMITARGQNYLKELGSCSLIT